MTDAPVPADPTWWQITTDAVIPALAIVVSTLIAIGIARWDRADARKSAVEDRADAASARERDRVERLLAEVLELYAVFISGNPHTTDYAPVVRQLRARLMIAQTIPSSAVIGLWLAEQTAVGFRLYDESMRAFPFPNAPVDQIVAAMRPVADWANQCVQTIAGWLSGSITDDDLHGHLQRTAAKPSGTTSDNT